MEEEILQKVKMLWILVQKDRSFPFEIVHGVERLLDGSMNGLDAIKELGTELYREVGRSDYPDADPRRDGIRSMSHFIMGYWDIGIFGLAE